MKSTLVLRIKQYETKYITLNSSHKIKGNHIFLSIKRNFLQVASTVLLTLLHKSKDVRHLESAFSIRCNRSLLKIM